MWAFFSNQVAYVFAFPNNITDAVVHLVTSAVMIGVALIQIRLDGGLKNTLADLRSTGKTLKSAQRETARRAGPVTLRSRLRGDARRP